MESTSSSTNMCHRTGTVLCAKANAANAWLAEATAKETKTPAFGPFVARRRVCVLNMLTTACALTIRPLGGH